MKRSFTLIELIFVVLMLSIVLLFALPKKSFSKLKLAKEQIILHLKYTRYLALLDNKYKYNEEKWYKKRWSLKFFNCDSSIGGIYYMIYSDKNKTGQVAKDETLKDPLTQKYIYSNQCENDSIFDKLEQVQITKYFGVVKAQISCNSTDTVGQISFGNDGEVYTKLTNEDEEYILDEICEIKLFDKDNNKESIFIEPKTGYIYQN